MLKRIGMGARMLLAAIGGLAGQVAGVEGHYAADKQTPKRVKGLKGTYGQSLQAHFATKRKEALKRK